jgi:DNA-binding NtrC family response regulator
MNTAQRGILPTDRAALAGLLSDRAIAEAVLQVSEAMHGTRTTDELAPKLLRWIGDWIPSARSAVVIPGRAEPYRLGDFLANAAIVKQVQEERVGILSNTPDPAICAPVQIAETRLGAIYLENQKSKTFTMDQLRLLTAVAAIAAKDLDHALHVDALVAANKQYSDFTYGPIVGESPAVKQLLTLIGKVARSDASVLILGETGTGKELIAHSIHEQSARALQRFVPVNCAGLSDELMASQLFGHEKGGFTGAIARKIGLVERAAGGTLFLDEFGELSATNQSKLLRFLQDFEFERVGGTELLHANVRIIAATNRNLQSESPGDRFRQDLFHRFKLQLQTVSLRDMSEDIPRLAEHFRQKDNRLKRTSQGISAEAYEMLVRFPWPGNIRQLENAIHHALVFGDNDIIQPDDLPTAVTDGARAQKKLETLAARMKQSRKEIVEQTWIQSGKSQVESARILEVTTRTMYNLLKEFDLLP